MRPEVRILVVAASALSLLVWPGALAYAQGTWTTSFRDDFDSPTLDLHSWTVEQMSGELVVSDGWLRFQSVPTGLPTVSSNPGIIPVSGDFRVRIGFQYGRTFCYGT